MADSKPSKFAHVVYRTRRFQQMLDWYALVFGARIQHRDPALAFLTYDDEHHRFAFADLDVLQPESGDERGVVGVDHVAWTWSSLTDLLTTWERLADAGVTPYWCVHHGITASLYYADPDGNQMEFQVDALDADADPAAYMAEHFATNPVGVEFEPGAWLTALRAGTPESSLLAALPDGPVSPIRGALA